MIPSGQNNQTSYKLLKWNFIFGKLILTMWDKFITSRSAAVQ